MQIKRLLILCCFIVVASCLSAQTGSISGLITDGDMGGGLPGASIYLKASPGIGAVTELEGDFILQNVPVGVQTIVISYIGFASEEREVTVTKGGNAKVNVALGGQVILGEEVIVTAQALGQAKAINQQLASDGVANFVSADKIKELPDVNAAEAISRLPGVAINRSGGEGSKIVVRGLDPKFTVINVNGVRLPSTSGSDRSVDLSLISPELLSGIELFKSPTPDMDGDAIGGTVNLNIIKADDRPRASLKAIGGYNDVVQEFKDYKFTGSLSRRLFKNKLGVIATGNIERFNRSGRIVGQGWGDNLGVILDTMNNIFDQWATSLRFNHREEIRRRYNASLGLDYAFGKSTDVTVLGVYSRTTREQFTQNENYGIGGYSLTPSLSKNGISLYSGSLSTRHKLDFMSIEWGVSHSIIQGETPFDLNFNFGGGIGEGAVDPEVQNFRDDPSNIYDFVNADVDDVYLNNSGYTESGNEEAITGAFIDLKLPFNLGDKWRGEFKFGGKFRRNDKSRYFREFRDRLYYLRTLDEWDGFVPGGALPAANLPPTYLGVVNFLDNGSLPSIENNRGQDVNLYFALDRNMLQRFHELYEGGDFAPSQYSEFRYNIDNNYDLVEDMLATYAMFKFNLGEQLTIIPGVRYESNNNTYNGLFASLAGDWGESGEVSERTAEQKYGELLPHLHLKYKPLDWFDVRASYSTTLARPDFNYLVPSTLINRSGDITITKGNPNLGPSVSTNYDLYLTAFSGKFGLVSVGGFYKDIKDAFYPITTGVNNDSIRVANDLPPNTVSANLTTFDSSPDSYVYGFELDIQSNLNFLPKPFNNMVFNLNYARLFSSTFINQFREETSCVVVRGRPRCTTETFAFQREVALIGQAEQILNASLGYDQGGFSARVSAAYQGTKLSGYSSNADKDRFNREFWRMDAVVKYRFSRRLNVFLNLNNLTNQQDISFFRNERFETNRQTFGTTATVGVELKFMPREE